MNGAPEFNDFYNKQNLFYLFKQLEQYKPEIEGVPNLVKRAVQACIRGLGRALVRMGRSMERVQIVRREPQPL